MGIVELVCEYGASSKWVVAVAGWSLLSWWVFQTQCSFTAHFHHHYSTLQPHSVVILITFHHSCSEQVPLKIPIIKYFTRRMNRTWRFKNFQWGEKQGVESNLRMAAANWLLDSHLALSFFFGELVLKYRRVLERSIGNKKCFYNVHLI